MIICPHCKTRYDDDTLRFCLHDGTPLSAGMPLETPTTPFGETETVVSPRRQTLPGSAPGGWEQNPPPKSNTLKIVVLTALGMLFVFSFIGAGAWFYIKNARGETARSPIPDSNISGRPANLPTASPTPVSSSNSNGSTSSPTPTPLSPTETAEIKRDVLKTIMTWKSTAESRDLNSYMGNYADAVDYYNKKAASRSFVRDDKARAFTQYDSIGIDITNITVTPGSSGEEAIAVFDKEWRFEGETCSAGKVRQTLRLIRENDQWLIASERDIKPYYKGDDCGTD